MKSSIFGLLLAAVLLIGAALPFPAAAAFNLEQYTKLLGQRISGEELKGGACMCTAGTLKGLTGVIVAVLSEDAIGVHYMTSCFAASFDQETGRIDDTEMCDSTWTPLPQ